jgi:hypothetical protein
VAWIYNIADSALNFLSPGQTLTVSYNVTIDDHHTGGTATQTVTVTMSGLTPTVSVTISGTAQEGQTLTANATTNDSDATIHYQWQSSSDNGHTWSNISGATDRFYLVAESDETHLLRVIATTSDPVNSSTATATSTATAAVIDVAPTLTVPFSYAVDELKIVKTIDGVPTQIYDNTFTQAPPQSPDILKMGVPSPIEFISSGTWTESGGKAVMSSSNAVPLLVNDGVSAILNTNAQPQSTSDLGLKLGAAFTVSAKFDLANPAGFTGYGLGLTDGTSTHASDEVAQLVVQRMSGNVVVNLYKADFTNTSNPFTLVASQSISEQLAGNNQIELTLNHAAGSTVVTGSFTLMSGGHATSTTTFGDAGQQVTIFTPDVTWTRPQIFSFATPTTVTITDTTSHSGTVREGDVLAANAATNDADATIHYQWTRDSSNINGATGSTYTVVEADEGHVLRVIATTSDPDNTTATATSAATATVLDALPTITSVTISDTTSGSSTVREGDVLTASASGLRSDSDNTVSYQWQRSDDGSFSAGHISNIGTGSTYTVVEADENSHIRVQATATNGGGLHATATSTATATVLDVLPTLSVSISGNAIEGSTLTATATQSSDGTMTVAYQWQNSSDGTTWSDIGGATHSTYTLIESDENKFVRVHTSASDDTGQTVTADSSATASKVVDVFPTLSVSISGNAVEGSTLTATATQSSDETMAVAYQWQNSSDGTTWSGIGGATNSTYTLTESDENKFVRVHTSAADDTGQTVTADSSATASKVVDVFPTLSVSISGNAVEDSMLTATATQSSDETMAVAYQWQNSSDGTTWSDIGGATSSTYTLTESDDNKFVRVHTSATDDTGQTVTADSARTYVTTGEEDDWNTTEDGNWECAANWNHGVPSSSTASVIALSGSYTVSITSSTAQAGSLTINNSDAVLLADSDHALTIGGALTVNAGVISLTGGTIQAGSIDLETGTTLMASTNHNSYVSGDITGTGLLEIVNHTTLEIDGSVASTVALTFFGGEGAVGTLALDHSLTKPFSAVIAGLTDVHQQIDLKDFTFTSGHMSAATSSYANGHTTLTVSNDFTSQHVSFTLSGDYTTSSWFFAQDSGTGTIFYDPPAADAGTSHLNVAGSASTDLSQTVTAALTTHAGTADQFMFQSDNQSSGTPAHDSTLAASGQNASATDAAMLDPSSSASSDHQSTASTTTAVDIGPASTVATNSQPPTGDTTSTSTQAGATTQTTLAAPAAIGPNGDTFVFAANFGHETIANFHPETDVIEIDHTVFADFHAVLAAAHDDANGNAVIAANPNDTITVKNVTVAQLVQHQSDFHFT